MRRMYSQAYILELINKGISTKQDTLVSGLNIKTINNNSILGSGNLVIAGGGGAVDSVNGYTGAVVLTKSDIGLGNVDNTSDADKPISTAQATKNTEFTTNIDNKQDSLVSGTNIKTINGNTLLGSGDLAITTGSNVKKIDYSYTNTPISGIKVDNVDYRLVPIGADTDGSLAIGVGAHAPNSGSIAIGQYAGLDAGSDALAEGSIAIGNNTCENMPWHVSFDMVSDVPEISVGRSLDLYSPSKIFFRNENLTAANTYETQYTNGKTLQGYLDNKQDSLVSGTNIKTINGTSIIGSGDITVSGAKGDQGIQGIQGIQGDKGDKGDKGDTGATFDTTLYGASLSLNDTTLTLKNTAGTGISSVTLPTGLTKVTKTSFAVGDDMSSFVDNYNSCVVSGDGFLSLYMQGDKLRLRDYENITDHYMSISMTTKLIVVNYTKIKSLTWIY